MTLYGQPIADRHHFNDNREEIIYLLIYLLIWFACFKKAFESNKYTEKSEIINLDAHVM